MSELDEIQRLRSELHQHNYNYYVLSAPTISDFDFDQLMKQLQALEERHPEAFDPNSPTQRVGSDLAAGGFRQVKHQYPMLSLANTYSEADVADFYHRVERTLQEPFEIVCELKFDGTSISLIYHDGALVEAVTRGDGEKGDAVTDNIRTIRTVPLHLHGDYPEDLEIRGEVLLPWQEFYRLNEERQQQTEPLFANPRNAASGTLKLQNSREVARRKLDVYLYYLLGEDLPAETHYDNLQKAKSWGFKISEHMKCCRSLDEVLAFINFWDEKRHELPVATDGMVLKVNSLEQQQSLGYTAKSPRWAIAYKFQAEKASTRLQEVTFQVGRTGIVTPVANLDAVQLSGTTVRRATLHNADFIRQLDLHEGDMVSVEKGGEIIPKITEVFTDQRLPGAVPVVYPERCPECGTPLVRLEDEAATVCPNRFCPPQVKGRIEHFVSRKAMNIDGLGSETIALLYNKGLLHDVADLYDLTPMQLAAMDRMGEKSANNIMRELERSKQVPFSRVLFALGIKGCGEQVAKTLALNFPSIDALSNASVEQLTRINDIGEVLAQNVVEYFLDLGNIQLIDRLRAAGLTFETREDELPKRLSQALEGMSIVISGVFAHHSRDEYKQLIEQHGGKNVGSISKKTTMVLAGDNMGPAKLEKAQQLGIRIIGEDEFLSIIKPDNAQ